MSFQDNQHNHLINRFNKTRIAPTPSGYLHLGNAFSFILTSELAKKYGAKVLLRIDDLDRERVQENYVQDIFETLHFLNIEWQEGPKNIQEFEEQFSQLHRLKLYNKALVQLKQSGKIFACSCSRTQVSHNSENGAYAGTCKHKNIPLNASEVTWRLNTDDVKEITLNTLNEGNIKTQLPESMRYFVVRKKNGFPAYQLSSVVDDMYFGVDLIVRGQDLWDSTLAQLYLASVLEQEIFLKATFYHHALLTNSAGEKLSKSAGDTSIRFMREQGRTLKEIQAPFDFQLAH